MTTNRNNQLYYYYIKKKKVINLNNLIYYIKCDNLSAFVVFLSNDTIPIVLHIFTFILSKTCSLNFSFQLFRVRSFTISIMLPSMLINDFIVNVIQTFLDVIIHELHIDFYTN